jgi:cytochrome o ubiquinol oxidase subunit I
VRPDCARAARPKAFGFKLDERLGKAVFWCWFIGFYLAFMPLYALGLMGATRRMQHYPDTHWQPLMIVALLGAVVILIGIALTAVQLVVSIRQRRANRDQTAALAHRLRSQSLAVAVFVAFNAHCRHRR